MNKWVNENHRVTVSFLRNKEFCREESMAELYLAKLISDISKLCGILETGTGDHEFK